MSKLVRFEVVRLPTLFIMGKQLRYSDAALNGGDNRLPAFWDKCYEENIFSPLETRTDSVFDLSHAGVFLDWDLGDGDFSYIVGILMKERVCAPEGYLTRELPETDAALCWIKCGPLGKTRAVPFEPVANAIKEHGRSCANMTWCADLYHHQRSTTPDERGKVILDCYIPLD